MTYGCNRATAVPHPWLPIADVACGYDDRQTDRGCVGCHRNRAESALEQLQALDNRHTVDGIAR